MNDLPAGWVVRHLGEIAEVVGGVTKDSKKQSDPQNVEVPYLRVANVQRGHFNLSEVATIRVPPDTAKRLELRRGDVLLNEGGDRDKLGRGWVWEDQIPGCIHQNHVFRARLHDGIAEPRWLAYYANELGKDWFDQHAAQTTNLASISLTKIKNLPVPLPPIENQRRIIEILEDHLSRLDAAARFRRAGELRLAAFRQVQIQSLVGSPRTGRLADLVERIEAGKSFGTATRSARDGEWGIVRVSAMTWGEFRANENKAVLDESFVDPRFEIGDGDVLVSRANTPEYVGAPVFVRNPPPRLLLSDKSLRLVPRPGISPEWLYRVLSAPASRRQMTALATGTKESMRNISQASLLTVEVPIVDEMGQAEVVRAASELDRVLIRMATALADIASRTNALRQTLLQAAFTGRLTERTNTDVEELARG